jgi:hypothetical protein
MRARGSSHGLSVLAIAGTHVVMLGWDMALDDIRAQSVLGFAIRRTRASDGSTRWLEGLKTFASVEPDVPAGVGRSSHKHPFQTFQWADYAADPAATYTYRIAAMGGTPGHLHEVATVDLEVTTEPIDQGRHAIFFNRGAIASQEYAARFHNEPPSEVGQAAFDWLSRGLVEGLEAFIDRAGPGDVLHGAFYEFANATIFQKLEAARGRGATVEILYDGDSAKKENEDALAASGAALRDATKAREHSGGFAHNKFLIYAPQGAPAEVWTGSTNLSDNGIYGHSNNAHIVRDAALAARYEQYWQLLWTDVTRKPTATAATALTPAPADSPTDTVPVFSPRLDLGALQWYADLAAAAQRGLFMTFAFGMNDLFVPAFDRTDDVLRFALMEKEGTGRQIAEQTAVIERIRKRPNVTVAVGNRVEVNAFDRWLAEISNPFADNVFYIHTKYMLVDPLGDDPVVVMGSANFSKGSTTDNDENMLVIRGNPSVADVYLGEFLRLFTHYAFRESLKWDHPTAAAIEEATPGHLVETVAWADAGYFTAGRDRYLRRLYFSGR